MCSLLNFSFEDSSSCGFVILGDLEDMGSVDPVVDTAAHDMVAFDRIFVDWDLRVKLALFCDLLVEDRGLRLTLLYVAEYIRLMLLDCVWLL